MDKSRSTTINCILNISSQIGMQIVPRHKIAPSTTTTIDTSAFGEGGGLSSTAAKVFKERLFYLNLDSWRRILGSKILEHLLTYVEDCRCDLIAYLTHSS